MTPETQELQSLYRFHLERVYRDGALRISDTAASFIPGAIGNRAIDEQSSAALPTIAAGETTILTFIVPQGFDCIIRRLSHNFTGGGFVQGSGDIIWRILIDNAPVRNFQNMTTEKGSWDQPREIDGIRAYSGQTIRYNVVHAANAALAGNVICSLNGSLFPSEGN